MSKNNSSPSNPPETRAPEPPAKGMTAGCWLCLVAAIGITTYCGPAQEPPPLLWVLLVATLIAAALRHQVKYGNSPE